MSPHHNGQPHEPTPDWMGDDTDLDPDLDTPEVQAEIARRVAEQQSYGRGEADDRDEAAPAPPPAKPAGSWAFSPISSRELSEGDFRPEWLVRRVLVAGEPGIVGAPQKSLKTNLMIDLALSLGTGTPMLGRFDVPRKVPVAILSGESGRFTIQETARRIAGSKGVELARADVLWGFELPQLGDLADVGELADGVKARGVRVCIIDPLYLSLLTGAAAGPDAAKNVYAIGPLLLGITRQLRAAGCTPILVHHSNKSIPAGEPMELSSLSGAGCAEFAAQWLLVNRREPYRGDGNHSLWLNIGGRCGQGGLFAARVSEGTLGDDFAGRVWEVEVDDAPTAFKRDADTREFEKREAGRRKCQAEEAEVLLAIDAAVNCGQPAASQTEIKDRTGFRTQKVKEILERLTEGGTVEEYDFDKTVGNNATRSVKGYKKVHK